MESALFFYDKEALVVEVFPKKPVRILFLTSLRDIALEEYNGQSLKIGGQDTYIKGVIEKTLEETQKVSSLKGLVEVSGVIVDDVESDLKGKFSLLPSDNSCWIFPTQLLPKDSIWNIPSEFRKLPKGDVKGKIKLKYQFENLVFKKMQEIGADVLIIDSYMAKIEYLYNLLPSRVINIHPGPTLLSRPFCFRGKDPIGDAIKIAKINGGPVYTGATLHLVNERLDDGKFIAYVCNTPVNQEDDEIKLMVENYQKAKLPIFISGLRHYVLKIYPYL